MGNYDYEPQAANRQRDLVLSVNEYCFLQNKTNGSIKVHVGPLTMTISAQDALVVFDEKTKKFIEVPDFEKAKQLFMSAPEGWYAILKNPTTDGQYPEGGKANPIPQTMVVGTKVNIPGPISTALYPGQMARVIRGHRLRSNQYLLARVYDAAAAKANMSTATVIDADGKEKEAVTEDYFMGQLLVIKGTEISFYIPPTGIEVIPINNNVKDGYVRDAVTLERLEYAILKDEDGEKRYVHGPAVVFPKPTETFVEAPKGGTIFRALELSPISGIYIKVIADYEENGVKHPTGEELFITGNEQMIYYPRPEHAMIQYDGKYMHHAIAIPEGEGRYILNRLTGEINTVRGPKMYLPDPRTEVVVKRKLSDKECELLYPNNKDVLAYNHKMDERKMEQMANKGLVSNSSITDALNAAYSTSNQESTLAIFEANANISRGVSYTKPRTITLDTKYDGVVSVDVWTGYAINVISKTGTREVVVGPTTRLFNYDETIEPITLSTGKPKSTDNLLTTGFLRIENNKVSDLVRVQTKDFVNVDIRISYCVNFLEEYKDKWFSVENYVKHLTDHMRSLLKREVKNYTIQDFYNKATDIIRNVVVGKQQNKGSEESSAHKGYLFRENGMLVYDAEVLRVDVEKSIAQLLDKHQFDIISKTLELTDAKARFDTVKELADIQEAEAKLAAEAKEADLNRAQALLELKQANDAKNKAADEAARAARVKAEQDLQPVYDAIEAAKLERQKRAAEQKVAEERAEAAVEEAKQKAYAETVKSILASIAPGLIEALNSSANADTLKAVTESISPYALANGDSVSGTVDKLLRGTTLEGFMQKFSDKD